MNLDSITPLVIAYNEQENIQRCLDGLRWAKRIVVVDSGSTDRTLEICASFPQVVVVYRKFDAFAEQCNFGLTNVETEWVLSFDSDYMVEPAFVEALRALPDDPRMEGYSASFIYCVYGRKLRSGVYPPRTVLYRVKNASYENDGHGHRVRLKGPIGKIPAALLHDDRKPLDRWINSQVRYAIRESDKLESAPLSKLSKPDRIRLKGWAAPLIMLPYCLLFRGGILDGKAGIYYAFQRTFAELLLSLRLLDRELISPEVRDSKREPKG